MPGIPFCQAFVDVEPEVFVRAHPEAVMVRVQEEEVVHCRIVNRQIFVICFEKKGLPCAVVVCLDFHGLGKVATKGVAEAIRDQDHEFSFVTAIV